MTIKPVALLAAVLSFSAVAFADKPPVGSPDPNAVSSYQQTVYRGQSTDSLLTLLQTVGMDPGLTVHKAADGTQVGPFITRGALLGWSYISNAPTSSGNSYPVPPANFRSGAPAISTARILVETQIEFLSFTLLADNAMYTGVFQYAFNTKTKQWEWEKMSYTATPMPTPPTPKK